MDDIRATGPTQATPARIRRSRDSICQDWLAAVRARVPATKDKPASLIIDSLPECLLHYAVWMAGEDSAQQKLRELGKEHGEQRAKLGGFSLDQILLEYSLLREVMLGVLQREEPLAGPELRRLLAADVDRQWANPLALVRRSVSYPTEVLAAAGVPPVVRDEYDEAHFPGDVYGLTPRTFTDVDPSLRDVALVWGAAKARASMIRHS